MDNTISAAEIRALVEQFRFKDLFNELGWNRYGTALPISVAGQTFQLMPVAEKAGVVVFQCPQGTGATRRWP